MVHDLIHIPGGLRLKLLLAALSGLLLGLAFPPFCRGWISFLALIPVLYAIGSGTCTGRRHAERFLSLRALFGLGWFFGLVFFLVLLHWIACLTTERMVYPALRVPAAIVAAAYLACYPGFFAMGLGFVCRRLGWRGMWVAPFFWTVVEVARGSGTLGFPWGAAAYGLVSFPSLIQGASLGGVDLISFWIVLVNVLGVRCISGPAPLRRRAIIYGVAGTLILMGPVLAGRARIPDGPCPRLGIVGLVQPCARGDEKWDPANRDSSFAVLERGTRRLLNRGVDMVVWPETAVPLYLRYDQDFFERTACLAREASRPLLVGFPDAGLDENGEILKYNAAGLFSDEGRLVETYWKIHLVPFGEALPWQNVFPVLARIDLGEGDYSPGRDLTVFDGPLGRFSVLVCFESIFPRLVRQFVNTGADYLTNITNDDWFGDTPAAAQHAAMAVFRAVENGVCLVRCANSGISGVVDPYGRVEVRTPLFEETEIAVPVRAPLGNTVYRRTGNAFLWVCGVVVALSLLAAALARGRNGVDKTRCRAID